MPTIYGFYPTMTTGTFVADTERSALFEWRRSYYEGSEPRVLHIHQPSLRDRWIEFEGELDFRTTEPTPKQALDFVKFSPASGVFGVRDSVLDKTDGLWGLVEVLPLRCRDDDYSAIHIPKHHDILDLANSTYGLQREGMERVLSSGRLTTPDVLSLDTSPVLDVDLFRVPEMSAALCSQGFVDRLNELGVTGFSAGQVFPPTAKQLAEEARLLALFKSGKMHGEVHFRPAVLD